MIAGLIKRRADSKVSRRKALPGGGPGWPVDRLDRATRSHVMSRIRGSDTKPEIMVRRALWQAGLRYRLHASDVPGRPDVSSKTRRVAVFVDGCFWHGCPAHYRRPQSRQGYWDAKLARNRARRVDVRRRLKDRGWRYVEVWECQVAQIRCTERVVKAFKTGAGISAGARSRSGGRTPPRIPSRVGL